MVMVNDIYIKIGINKIKNESNVLATKTIINDRDVSYYNGFVIFLIENWELKKKNIYMYIKYELKILACKSKPATASD